MRKLLPFLLFLFLVPVAHAQDETRSSDEMPEGWSVDLNDIDRDQGNMMLIPFEPKMYMSDVDRTVGQHNGLDFNQVRGFFRLGLDNALTIESNKYFQTIRMHADETDINRDLLYIYKSIGYEYAILPVEEEEKKGVDKIIAKLKPEDPQQEGYTKVEEGQVVNAEDTYQRFMKTKVINEEMFGFLKEKYDPTYLLFINQFDIRTVPGTDYRDLESENYQRFIRAHYTIFDAEGNEVDAGTSVVYFSSRENDLRNIIAHNFPELAELVMENLRLKLFPPEEETEEAAETAPEPKN